MRRGPFRVWKGWRPMLNPCRGGELVWLDYPLHAERRAHCSMCRAVLAAVTDKEALTAASIAVQRTQAGAREHLRP